MFLLKRKENSCRLHEAVRCNDYKAVKELLGKGFFGVNINVEIKDKTPLMVAAKHGYANIVELLLKHRANPNKQDSSGNTALMFACLNGREDVIRSIFDHKKTDISINNKNGENPLGIISKQSSICMALRKKEYDKALEYLESESVWIPLECLKDICESSISPNRIGRVLTDSIREHNMSKAFTIWLLKEKKEISISL